MAVQVLWAREPLPVTGPSVFLAGPTPRGHEVPSWRPAAIEALAAAWPGADPLTVLTPESRGGQRADHYDDQFEWETAARAAADVVLFWIPRDVQVMPAFTTNVEFGHDITTGRAVLGCPEDCPNPERNRYLIHLARHYGVTECTTLADTVNAALRLLERSGGSKVDQPQLEIPDETWETLGTTSASVPNAARAVELAVAAELSRLANQPDDVTRETLRVRAAWLRG